MSQPLTPTDLLKLVSGGELEEFARLLDCKLSTPNPRDELVEQVQSCSRTKVLSALISINGIWITMMREVVRFLERFDVSLRTTGCVLALPINGKECEVYLSPQLVNMMAKYDLAAFRRNTASDWDNALSQWSRFPNWIKQIADCGKPYWHRRLSQRRIAQVAMRAPVTDLYEHRVLVDRQAAERAFRLWRTLNYLNAKLASVGDLVASKSQTRQIADGVKKWSGYFDQQIREMRSDPEMWEELSRNVKNVKPWSDSWAAADLFADGYWQHDRRWDDWVRFIEDVLSLASLEASSETEDLLRLDLLKDRPRLFEVWCMAQILVEYRAAGCSVHLLSIKDGEPPVWNLNYARASEPVARVEYGGVVWWLFYQLFSTGPERANMPDLALLDGSDPSSNVVWIVDPKYSEAQGYSRNNYVEVAERYRDAFRPHHVWICEFFARRGWFDGACYEQGDRFTILTEVQPRGEGIRLLRDNLRELHSLHANRLVLAIDCSGSFAGTLPDLEADLVALSDCAAAVVCFAGKAMEIGDTTTDLSAILGNGKLLGKGTLLQPLVEVLENLTVRDPSHTELVLITDSGFGDASSGLMARLEGMFSGVKVAGNHADLVPIVAEHCGERTYP